MFKRTWPYDMWSTGVVWLELVFATPHVFQISSRSAALLQRRMHNKPQARRHAMKHAMPAALSHAPFKLAAASLHRQLCLCCCISTRGALGLVS